MSPSQSTQTQVSAPDIEFVDIPETQLKVSRVALGTWAMGGLMWGGTDQRESIATEQRHGPGAKSGRRAS